MPLQTLDKRIVDLANITTERVILQYFAEKQQVFNTDIAKVDRRIREENQIGQDKLGVWRDAGASKAVIADMELLQRYRENNLDLPSFLEAGPRKILYFKPHEVR